MECFATNLFIIVWQKIFFLLFLMRGATCGSDHEIMWDAKATFTSRLKGAHFAFYDQTNIKFELKLDSYTEKKWECNVPVLNNIFIIITKLWTILLQYNATRRPYMFSRKCVRRVSVTLGVVDAACDKWRGGCRVEEAGAILLEELIGISVCCKRNEVPKEAGAHFSNFSRILMF